MNLPIPTHLPQCLRARTAQLRGALRISVAGVALLITACDRIPTDPAVLTDHPPSWLVAAPPTSLSQLFRSSIERVEQERGASEARRLLANWRRLNDEARAALSDANPQAAQSQVEAVRAEEVRVVAQVLGAAGVAHVVSEVTQGLAQAQVKWRAAEAEGKDVRRAANLADEVAQCLNSARRAIESTDYPAAIDQVTRASDRLDGLVHFLITLYRIPGLETFFSAATTTIRSSHDSTTARALLARLERLDADARAALLTGDREQARRKLELVRQEQIRIVLRQDGTGAVDKLLSQVDAGVAATRPRLASIADSRLQQRAARMITEAAQLNTRAHAALKRDDAAMALDLGSHAAGLINALQHLLPH